MRHVPKAKKHADNIGPPRRASRVSPQPAKCAANRGDCGWRWPPWRIVAGGYFLVPLTVRAFTTISTDDAYVNGHVTMVAARVPGQVIEVLVDDNNPRP